MILFLFLCSLYISAEKIKEINIEGNIFFEDNVLLKTMKSRTGKSFDRITFKEDRAAMISFYRAKGFLDFSVKKFAYRIENDLVYIDIEVNEDYVTTVSEVKIFGNSVFTDDEIKSILGIKKNDPLNLFVLSNRLIQIVDKYSSLGYIYADADYELVLKENKYRMLLFINITEGSKAYIRSISGDSLPKNVRNVFYNEVKNRNNTLYTPENVYLIQQRVSYTGLFDYLAFKTNGIEEKSESIDIYFIGTEKKKNWISGASLYQFPNKFKLTAGWGNDNLFNNGEKLSLEASGALALLSSPMRTGDKWVYGILRYKMPYVFYNILSFNSQVGANYELYEFYSKKDLLAKGGVSKTIGYFSIFNNYSYKLSIIDTNVNDQPYRYERVTTNSSDLTFYFDNRDNVISPTKGAYSTLLLEYAGGIFRGYNNFYRYSAEGAYFKTFFNAVTTAFRIKTGGIIPFGVSEERGISIGEQFNLGGLTSVRGVNEDSLGPLNAIGTRSGNMLVNANAEMRALVYKFIGLSYFFDAGVVYENVQSFSV
ncbi:MAG: BamA/TamA family outer membrane protein, partial [bacterium]|nr:BamA/TamA family outer membrane protein [bacterium]